MDPERWEIVQQVFWEARDLPDSDRARLLDDRCGSDVELLEQVRALLAGDAKVGPEFLQGRSGFPPLAGPSPLLERSPPVMVGPYVVSAELGRGGMGVVYRAHDPRLGRDVALKFLPAWMLRDPGAEARFIAEARAASALDHPNNVTVYDIGTSEDGRRYIAMAYYDGGSLATRLGTGPLPIPEAVRIALEVASALDAAHEAGIVHRDVKPANIAFGSGGQSKVLDYGIATLGGSESLVGGTLAYMAPERVRGETGDRRVDVWALGVVLYEMLTGRRPFRGLDPEALRRAILVDDPEPIAALRLDAPSTMTPVLARVLAKDPAHRFSTAAEFADALRQATTTTGATKRVAVPPRRSFPHGQVARVAAIGLVVVAAIAVVWKTRSSPAPEGEAEGLDQRAVAVLPFRVRGAPSLAYLRDGMVDLLAAKLTGEGGLRAADPRAVYRAWRRRVESETDDLPLDATIALARDLGVGQALIGDVVGTPSGLVLHASVVDARGAVLGRGSAGGTYDALPDLVDQLVGELLSSSAGEQSQRIASLTSTSLVALRAYLEGQAAYRRGRYDEALVQFGRALDHDSAFALAGLGLTLAAGWVGGAEDARARGGAVAWRHRQRMSERDRALVTAVVGPSYPHPPSARALLEATERALELSPTSVELWYRLGDLYLHYGRFLTGAAWETPAILALGRAVEIDSTSAQVLHHLLMVYARVGDTAALRTVAIRHLAEDATAASAEYVRWRASLALSDTRIHRVVLDSLSSEALAWIAITAQDDGMALEDGYRAVTLRGARPGTRDERFERSMARYSYALNGGRPAEALSISETLRDVQPDPTFHLRLRILGALYGAGDTEAAAHAAAELARLAQLDSMSACVLEQWRQLRAPNEAPLTSPARQPGSVDRSRRDTATSSPSGGTSNVSHSICAAVVEALRATGTPQGPVPRSVWGLDSLLAAGPVTGPVADGHSEYAHLALARLFERWGDRAAALTAIRRRLYFLGWQPYLAGALREEARLAESMGEDRSALIAYEHLLALQANPEPSGRPERDRVQRAVARLRQGVAHD